MKFDPAAPSRSSVRNLIRYPQRHPGDREPATSSYATFRKGQGVAIYQARPQCLSNLNATLP
jgi:hypothetical protein